MLSILKGAWQDLSAKGRAVVIVVLILAVAGLLAMAMWLGYRLDWLPNLLDKALTWQPINLC